MHKSAGAAIAPHARVISMSGKFWAFFAMFVLFASIIAGCASQAQVSGSAQGEVNAPAKPAPDVNGSIDEAMPDTKTPDEKMNETIALAIADGTYADEVSYNYHSGSETVLITVVVKNDIVTDASVVSSGGDAHPYSLQMQQGLNAELPNLVIGKKINEIELPKNVGGSSLTTAAFQAHLQTLIEQN